MPVNTYFNTLFGAAGTRAAVPDAIQTDGTVSYEEGYGVDYTLDPAVNPSALDVEENKFNQLMYDVTAAIQFFQQGNAAKFITSAMNLGSDYVYPAGATVLYGGVTYRSLVGSNADTPPSAKWAVVPNDPAAAGRTLLTTSKTYYVATTGNDSTGDGSVGSPWLTIQHAINFVMETIDLGGQTVTIQVANGTYTGGMIVGRPFTGGGQVYIQGNTTTPSSCIISTTSADCLAVAGGAEVYIQGFKLTTTTGGRLISSVNNSMVIVIGNMEYGATPSGWQHLFAGDNSGIIVTANYTVSGGGAAHLFATTNSFIAVNGLTVTLSGTPAFSIGFAVATVNSTLEAYGMTFAGTGATGSRFVLQLNGVINVQVPTPTYFPGSIDGSIDSNSVYCKNYYTSQQTITAGGTLTLAHGLPFAPDQIFLQLVNETAELGYIHGDTLSIYPGAYDANTGIGCSVWADDTNIYVQYGSNSGTFYVNERTGTPGSAQAITNANWHLNVKAKLNWR